jgi:hypothetical protein
MQWTKLHIHHGADADRLAGQLIRQVSAAWLDAGRPDGAEVYRVRIPTVGHVFYFSGEAAAISVAALAGFEDVLLVDPPNLAGLERIAL